MENMLSSTKSVVVVLRGIKCRAPYRNAQHCKKDLLLFNFIAANLNTSGMITDSILIDLLFYFFIYLRVCLDCKLGVSVQNCVCLTVCQGCVGSDGYVSACVNCTTR